MSNIRIKILQDTPFHVKDSLLTEEEFRSIYPVFRSSNLTMGSRVFKDKTLLTHRELESTSKFNYGEYFEIIEKYDLEPLAFYYENLLYVKEFDGRYHAFINSMFYKEFKANNCHHSFEIKSISIPEARKLIFESKFKKEILFCTNDVNQKL